MNKNIYPAVQFHFDWRELNPTRPLDSFDRDHLEKYVPFAFCGLVDIQFLRRRLIITSTTPQDKHEEAQAIFEENLMNALKELKILS